MVEGAAREEAGSEGSCILDAHMKRAAVGFAFFILAIIILADRGRLGIFEIVYRIPFGDKAGHFVLYGILSLLVNLALFQTFPGRPPKRIVWISGLVLLLLIGVEEFSQKYFPARTFSYLDLAAGYLGVLVFSLLSLKIRTASRET